MNFDKIKTRKHKNNDLLQNSHRSITGHEITFSLAMGVNGEVFTIFWQDHNLYPDDDSRSEPGSRERTIRMSSIEDWKALRNILDYQIKESKKTVK